MIVEELLVHKSHMQAIAKLGLFFSSWRLHFKFLEERFENSFAVAEVNKTGHGILTLAGDPDPVRVTATSAPRLLCDSDKRPAPTHQPARFLKVSLVTTGPSSDPASSCKSPSVLGMMGRKALGGTCH